MEDIIWVSFMTQSYSILQPHKLIKCVCFLSELAIKKKFSGGRPIFCQGLFFVSRLSIRNECVEEHLKKLWAGF